MSSKLGGKSVSGFYSMFPIVEKTYRAKITDEIEKDLRFLGQSRIDALISNFDMTLLKEKQGLKLYELCEKEFYTMKGVTTVNAPLSEVMQLLKMQSNSKFVNIMGEIFGSLFLDGLVLYKAKVDPSRMNESLSVNWMALQSSKPHLPHRDYVFLRYGDIFEKNAQQQQQQHPHLHQQSTGSNSSYVGVSIWESIELDGCPPLPASQNVVRLRLRRCGIVVEEEIGKTDELKISFFLSEAHPGRAAVSTLTRTWMTKMVSCVKEIGNTIVAKALSSQVILSKNEFVKDGASCFLCLKSFTVLRRKHHCRVCGDVVCSKCSEMKNLKQSRHQKETRVCQQCFNGHSSSGSESKISRNYSISSQKQSNFSFYSNSSSEASHSICDDDGLLLGNLSLSSNAPPSIPENYGAPLSNCSSFSEPRMKTYPNGTNGGTRNRQRSVDAPNLNRNVSDSSHTSYSSQGNKMSMSSTGSVSSTPLHSKPPALSSGGMKNSDMILLGTTEKYPQNSTTQSDMILLNTTNAKQKNHAYMKKHHAGSSSGASSGVGHHYNASDDLTSEEIARMELAHTIRENTPFSYAISYSSRYEWPKAPMPYNEPNRLKKVRELHLVDPGNHFQEMCEYAAAEMGCQIAAICFIGDKSGFLMAKVGLDKRELPRNILFDSHTIMSEEATIILDATEDVRFINNPLVKDGNVRFYAGFPLITSDGHIVGSFSVADPFARECLTGDKYFFLKNLADMVIRGVEQNTLNKNSPVNGGSAIVQEQEFGIPQPPTPPSMNMAEAQMTMQELLRTAYSTQCQMRMQVYTMQ
jgi:hypothetical protein